LDKEILQSLPGSDFEWLHDLLQALGHGRIQEFATAIHRHQEYISRFPAIVKEVTYLQQKVRIIAFLEMLFQCNKDERSITFAKVVDACLVERADVELLLMKTMSLGLVKGTIDEVAEVVHVDWMMPRYLNQGHIRILANRLHDWEVKMENVIHLVESQSEELLKN
jgi:26S proteasome regulatory subunit N9